MFFSERSKIFIISSSWENWSCGFQLNCIRARFHNQINIKRFVLFLSLFFILISSLGLSPSTDRGIPFFSFKLKSFFYLSLSTNVQLSNIIECSIIHFCAPMNNHLIECSITQWIYILVSSCATKINKGINDNLPQNIHTWAN